MDISQKDIKTLLSYNKKTGSFHWKFRDRSLFKSDRYWKWWNKRYSGKEAGCIANGYRIIRINSCNYMSHRLAWIYETGKDACGIDHIDHNGSNNKLSNLREATQQENCKNQSPRTNNASGVTGVCWTTARGRWLAFINVNGKGKHLGTFRDFDKAVSARKKAEVKYGYHKNHGV